MLTRDAPRSLPVTRQINYGKNLTRHDWLSIAEFELVINCLVANCFLRKADEVSKPPPLADRYPLRRVTFIGSAFLHRSESGLAVPLGRQPLVHEAPAQLAGATRRSRQICRLRMKFPIALGRLSGSRRKHYSMRLLKPSGFDATRDIEFSNGQ